MSRHNPRTQRRGRGVALASTVLVASLTVLPAVADDSLEPVTSAGRGDASQFAPEDAITPHEGPYGFFIDTYRNNTSDNMTVESNPTIGVLSPMLDYWSPGESWNDGTVLDQELHDQNIAQVAEITAARTEAEGERAYILDRRSQSYSMIEGLGPDADSFMELTNAGTTVTEIPDYAYERSQHDEGNSNGVWADTDGPLGSAIELVDTVRGELATIGQGKQYFQYMRPFRWSDEVTVEPALVAHQVPDEEAMNDAGFPSGHTNAAYLASYGLAVAAPEHYDDLMLKAAELGHSRLVAGVHSPFDVISGRITAAGIAGSIVADPANQDLVTQARADTQEQLSPEVDQSTDRDEYQADLARYLELTMFDFEPVADTTRDARVPAGAEALLATRYPYLDDEQIRWILHSTALESGHVLVDDEEGWGRTNLFAAANGFAAFGRDVAVELDAEGDGLASQDIWRNDISGPGGLTKAGSGDLTLAGENSFEGGVLVEEGSVVATLGSSFGTGDVELLQGELVDASDETLLVGGDFASADSSSLRLTQDEADSPSLEIAGSASLGGALELDLSELSDVPDELLLIAHDGAEGTFSQVDITGASDDHQLDYRADGVYLVQSGDGEPAPTDEPTDSEKPDVSPPRTGVDQPAAPSHRRTDPAALKQTEHSRHLVVSGLPQVLRDTITPAHRPS